MAESEAPPTNMEVVVLSVGVKATLGVMVRDEQGLRCVRIIEEEPVLLCSPHAARLHHYLEERVKARGRQFQDLTGDG